LFSTSRAFNSSNLSSTTYFFPVNVTPKFLPISQSLLASILPLFNQKSLLQLEMTNKLVPVGIARTRPRFDGESPHWLAMGMGMGNPRLFQLGMRMVIEMYISPP